MSQSGCGVCRALWMSADHWQPIFQVSVLAKRRMWKRVCSVALWCSCFSQISWLMLLNWWKWCLKASWGWQAHTHMSCAYSFGMKPPQNIYIYYYLYIYTHNTYTDSVWSQSLCWQEEKGLAGVGKGYQWALSRAMQKCSVDAAYFAVMWREASACINW